MQPQLVAEHEVEGPEDGGLAAGREAFDRFEAAEDAAARGAIFELVPALRPPPPRGSQSANPEPRANRL